MNNSLYEMISNITLGELVTILQNNIREDDKNFNQSVIEKIEKEATQLYDTNEMIEKYSFFTRYNLKRAVEEENLPYVTIGNKRLYEKKAVEKWLEDKIEMENKKRFKL